LIEDSLVAETVEVTTDHVDRFLEEIADELPPIDLEVEGIVDRICSLHKRLLRLSDETMAEFGLNDGEWKVLKHLRKAGPPYRRSAGQLARRIELSSGAMTNRLDRMEEAGLIRRLPDPDDRRGVQVELTDAGRRAWDDTISVQAAKEALVAEALNAKEKRQLNDLLRRLMLEFERR
jgi:DNA-binding MarR family transcriptional regulator